MGQMQPKESEGKREEAAGNVRHNPQNLKDRVGASFGDPHGVNPAYGKGGNGSKGNPGKPT